MFSLYVSSASAFKTLVRRETAPGMIVVVVVLLLLQVLVLVVVVVVSVVVLLAMG